MEQAERKRINMLLWQWGTALEDCERRREEIRRLMAQAEDATCVLRAQALTAMPRGSGVSDPTAAAVRMKDDALQRVAVLTEEINAIMARKVKMDAVIGMLPESRQTLLNLRYKRGMGLTTQIPMRMHISERTAFYWRDEILDYLCSFLQDICDNI